MSTDRVEEALGFARQLNNLQDKQRIDGRARARLHDIVTNDKLGFPIVLTSWDFGMIYHYAMEFGFLTPEALNGTETTSRNAG